MILVVETHSKEKNFRAGNHHNDKMDFRISVLMFWTYKLDIGNGVFDMLKFKNILPKKSSI